MSGLPRHRPAPVPCLLALALLLAVLLMPVLTSLGELHDLSHASSGEHVHLGHLPEHDGNPLAQAEPDEEGGDFHALLHAAHCAGHVAQVAPAAFPYLTAVPASRARLSDETPLLPASPSRVPYRPPIA